MDVRAWIAIAVKVDLFLYTYVAAAEPLAIISITHLFLVSVYMGLYAG